VLIIGGVLKGSFDSFTASIFVYLAAIPLLSSTLIFSPGMQSLGSFSLFLWAISFWFLYTGLTKKSIQALGLSLFFILAMALSYEVCFPLLAVSILFPMVCGATIGSRRLELKYFLFNFIGISLIVLIVLIYQKLLAPNLFGSVGNISRLRVNSFEGLSFILHLTNLLITEEVPKLLRKGLSITRHSPISLGLILSFILGAAGLILAFRDCLGRHFVSIKSRLILVLASIIGIIGVGVIHWGAGVGPSIYGYSNRGLGSLAVLLPLFISIVLGFFLNRSKLLNYFILLVALGIFGSQLSSFMLVRSNFIEIAKLQKNIMVDLNESFAKNSVVKYPRTVLADVPEFLLSDFNGENIYSDEVTDWSMSLEVFYPGQYISSATLTKKKVCATPKRVVIDGDNLVLSGPDISIPIKNLWFYRYDINSKQSSLIPIKDPKEMKGLLETQFDCSKQ